jgi:hypothetical protein
LNDIERIALIRRTYEDCLKHSPNNACTWGHEADIKFLIERHDALAAELAEAKGDIVELIRAGGRAAAERDALIRVGNEMARDMTALRALLKHWSHDGALQTPHDRDRFRTAVSEALRGTEVRDE